MITIYEVKQIVRKLPSKISILDDELIENISCIMYRNDVFECGNTTISSRHIDIEFSFGEYYEIHESTPVFQFIGELNGSTKQKFGGTITWQTRIK